MPRLARAVLPCACGCEQDPSDKPFRVPLIQMPHDGDSLTLAERAVMGGRVSTSPTVSCSMYRPWLAGGVHGCKLVHGKCHDGVARSRDAPVDRPMVSHQRTQGLRSRLRAPQRLRALP